MHVGKAFKEITSEGLGLFEPAGSHEVGGGIGRGYQFLEFLVQRAPSTGDAAVAAVSRP